ncbi:MAG TPA: hypothetical protein VKZ63_21835 [Kofleriaceae bacterium]|nr:hypothetical protein [Kofleriaceae bacterium]
MGEFVRRHPRLSLLTAAGVGVVAAPELAVGALIGAGAVMVASRRDRKRLVEEAESVRAESRGRTREMLDRAEVIGREVRTRARAVIQAARGKLAVEQEPSSGAGESGAGEEDWEEVRDEQPHPPASPAL